MCCFVAPFEDLFSYLSVYKLIRFYNPNSEEEYVTTRATLTLFSEFFFLSKHRSHVLISFESNRLDAVAADNVWFWPKMFRRLWKGFV